MIDWNFIYTLFIQLDKYLIKDIFWNFYEDNKLKSLEKVKKENNIKGLIKQLNRNKIFIDRINYDFKNYIHLSKSNNNKEKKQIYLFKNSEGLHFYTSQNGQNLGIIGLIIFINKTVALKNFKTTRINVNISGIKCENRKILGCSQNELYNDIAFIPYYIVLPQMCFIEEFKKSLKNFSNNIYTIGSLDKVINHIQHLGSIPHSINKLVFRGKPSADNKARKKLFSLYQNENQYMDIKPLDKNGKNFLKLEDQIKYKYIIDVRGGKGHSGRRYWMFHFNRVLFLPINDKFKLFWEVSKNPPKPWVHFIPYNEKNLEDIIDNIKILENDNVKYN